MRGARLTAIICTRDYILATEDEQCDGRWRSWVKSPPQGRRCMTSNAPQLHVPTQEKASPGVPIDPARNDPGTAVQFSWPRATSASWSKNLAVHLPRLSPPGLHLQHRIRSQPQGLFTLAPVRVHCRTPNKSTLTH